MLAVWIQRYGLDPEIAEAAKKMSVERHIGLSEAVNELARVGLTQKQSPRRFRQRTASVGLKVDVTKTADVLDMLDKYDAEDKR